MKITRGELDKMRRCLEPAVARDSRWEKLKALSDEKVKTWPNTLEAMRRKKENWKKEKLEEEEKRRVEIDKEEAELQKELRLKAIERANRMLYEQTDQMKGLRSQQMYSDVIYGRRSQIKEKQAQKEEEIEKEKEFHEALMRQLEQAEKRETKAKDAQRAKAASIAKAQRDQLGEFRDKHVQRLAADKKEGELVLKRAIADAEDDRASAEAKLRFSKDEMARTLFANEELKQFKMEQRKIEEEEDEKRKEAVKKKEHVAAERVRLERSRFDARQAAKQKLVDQATEDLVHRVNQDARRLELQVEEMRKKEEDKVAKKKLLIAQQKAAIDVSRKEQLEAKAKRKLEDDEQIRQVVAAWRLRNAEIDKDEADEASERRKQFYVVRETQEQQIQAHRSAKLKGRTDELKFDKDTQAAVKDADARFRATVMDVIGTAHDEGKPTLMIYKALHDKANDLQPASGLKV